MSQFLTSLVRLAARRPWVTLALLAIVTGLIGAYAVTNFRVNADQTSLVAPDADFQKRYDSFRHLFPSYRRTTLVVVEAASPTLATKAARDLAAALETRTDIIEDVFAPASIDFYRRNGLLYLSLEDLEARLASIDEAQPALAAVTRDPGLGGILRLINSAVEARSSDGEALPPALLQLATSITEAADDLAAGETPPPLSMNRQGDETSLQIITVHIREDMGDLMSPRATLEAIRDTAAELGLTPEAGVTIRLTGNVPLSTDELAQVQESLGLAGAISLVLLILILGFGVRSLRIVGVMIATLVIGGVWSMGWAMASVGELNILSATFAVLFVGLGIDFAIHYALRVQEDVEQGASMEAAIAAAGKEVGPAIALGALTSAIGFLSFMPTEYKGFADLGVIAGGGMICALLAALTVIPAAFAITGLPKHRRAGEGFASATSRAFQRVSRHAASICIVAGIIGGASVAVATDARFDFSTLTLKNAQSESIQALALLQERGLVTDYAAYIIVDNPAELEKTAETLAALPSVREVQTVGSLVPRDQDDKLALIQDTALGLLPVLTADTSAQPQRPLPDIAIPADLPAEDGQVLSALKDRVDALTPDTREALDAYINAEVNEEVGNLRLALEAEPISLTDVPPQMQARYVGTDGEHALVVGLPKEDLTDIEALRRFVTDVKGAFPDATGRAVVEATVGDVVVGAFMQAILIAAGLVTLIILLATRSVVDTLFVLTPLLLAAAATVATGVLIGMPFNQANIIVLPLIMGLGVDNGLHILLRFRHDGSIDSMLTSSTPRAVILSTLTTIAAFGALGISVHAGTASMGILLTIAMTYLLLATVVVLPSMLYVRGRLGTET